MPVTAKFSKAFYDKFGHEIVDELVTWLNQIDQGYRTELRELNDLNFARFDARLEQRLAEVRAELRQETATLRGDLRATVAAAESRLVRWMFGFWTASTLALLAALLALLR